MAAGPCHQQVLELVISTVTDTTTLVACSAVSQHFQQYTTRTVQLQLVHILQHCEELQPDSDLRPLHWLCSVAGAAAVNTTEAGCALLNLSRGAHDNLSALFQTTGLRLTNALVVHLAKQHVPHLAGLVRWTPATELSDVDWCYRAAAINDIDYTDTAVQGEFLSHVDSSNLADLLRIAINGVECFCNNRAEDCVDVLLAADQTRLHLLHPSNGSNAGGSRSIAADSLTFRAAGSSSSSSKELGKFEWQQQAAQLAAELLQAALMTGNPRLVAKLAAVPAAQHIGAGGAVRLLFCSIVQPVVDRYSEPSITSSLAGLPGARAASADCIATMIGRCIDTRRKHHLAPLVQLPGAKQISSKRLCSLVSAAGRADMHSVVRDLGSLAADRQLESGPIVALLKDCMETSWHVSTGLQDCLDWKGALNWLDPGRHLSGDDVLELLELFVHQDEHLLNYWSDICNLAPTKLQDVPRFVRCLKAAAEFSPFGEDMLSTVSGLPVMQRLTSDDWFELLCSRPCTTMTLPESVVQLPAVQQLRLDQVAYLLQGVRPCSAFAVSLCSLPAAQQLPAPLLSVLLHKLVLQLAKAELWEISSGRGYPSEQAQGGVPCWLAHFLALVLLPAARHLTSVDVFWLYYWAYDSGWPVAVVYMQRYLPQRPGPDWTGLYPQAGVFSPERLVVLTLQALDQVKLDAALMYVSEGMLPALSAAAPADIARLLLAFTDKLQAQPEQLQSVQCVLQQLPGFRQMNTNAVMLLLKQCVELGMSDTMNVYVSLPAVVQASTVQMHQLLKDCIVEGCLQYTVGVQKLPAWQPLLQLPAAQQLGAAEVVDLLQDLARDCVSDLQITEPVLWLPGAAAIDAAAAMTIVEASMRSRVSCVACVVLEHLPASQQLSLAQVKQLLLQGFESQQDWVCEKLARLPAAVAGAAVDAELQVLLDVLDVLPVVKSSRYT